MPQAGTGQHVSALELWTCRPKFPAGFASVQGSGRQRLASLLRQSMDSLASGTGNGPASRSGFIGPHVTNGIAGQAFQRRKLRKWL